MAQVLGDCRQLFHPRADGPIEDLDVDLLRGFMADAGIGWGGIHLMTLHDPAFEVSGLLTEGLLYAGHFWTIYIVWVFFLVLCI